MCFVQLPFSDTWKHQRPQETAEAVILWRTEKLNDPKWS